MSRAVLVYTDPVVCDASVGRPPIGWHQRALYLGPTGAAAWQAVSRQTPYLKTPEALAQLVQVVEHVSTPTVISLGPGDGETDFKLIARLARDSRRVRYVPVDLNPRLLRDAIELLNEQAEVSFGVITDFEGRFDYLDTVLHTWESIEHPALVTLLGGTLANLDRGEAEFLNGVRSVTRPGDFLLLEFPTLPEMRTELVGSASAVAVGRDFLINGVARQVALPVEVVAAADNFSIAPGTSDVPGTEALTIAYRTSAGELVTAIKTSRYDWLLALEWFHAVAGFRVVGNGVLNLPIHQIGFGAVLLQRT